MPLPDRMLIEHRVEGHHPANMRGRQLHQLGDVKLDLVAEPSEVALRNPQRRQQRGLARRIMREQLAILRERGVRELYLSPVRHGQLYNSTLQCQMVPCA